MKHLGLMIAAWFMIGSALAATPAPDPGTIGKGRPTETVRTMATPREPQIPKMVRNLAGYFANQHHERYGYSRLLADGFMLYGGRQVPYLMVMEQDSSVIVYVFTGISEAHMLRISGMSGPAEVWFAYTPRSEARGALEAHAGIPFRQPMTEIRVVTNWATTCQPNAVECDYVNLMVRITYELQQLPFIGAISIAHQLDTEIRPSWGNDPPQEARTAVSYYLELNKAR
jgi:hypothetical protein